MSGLRQEITTAWAVASGSSGWSDLKAHPIAVTTADGAVEAGVDSGGGLHLLIPVGDRPDVREDRRSRGVQIRALTVVSDGTERHFADVQCRAPHLREIFERLAGEIAERIHSDPQSPQHAAQAVLDRWRELLDREVPRFGPNQLAGLFGELWTLRRIVERDGARRVDCWEGPTGGRHDIRRGPLAIEVKTSSGREGRLLEIHGLLQLLPPTGGNLHLQYVRVERDDGGESVPELVRSIEEEGASASELGDRLALLGYVRSEEADYAQRFRVVEDDLYRVDDSFPRIVPDSFRGAEAPAGVLRLSYYADLTGALPSPLDEVGTDAVITAVSEG